MISLIKIYNGNMFQLHKRDANKILNKNVFLLYILIKEIVFNLCIEFVFLLYIEFAPPNSAKIRFRWLKYTTKIFGCACLKKYKTCDWSQIILATNFLFNQS